MSKPDNDNQPQGTDIAPANLSRRRLGLGLGAGAVFTLASRPVLAAECLTASAAMSDTLSSNFNASLPLCSGLSPSQWCDLLVPLTDKLDKFKDKADAKFAVVDDVFDKLHKSTSKGAYGDFADAGFHTLFPGGGRVSWGEASCLDVLRKEHVSEPGRPNPICAEFVAAYFNVATKRIPENVLDHGRLMSMWYEWRDTGAFSPRAGTVRWQDVQIAAYFQSLQG